MLTIVIVNLMIVGALGSGAAADTPSGSYRLDYVRDDSERELRVRSCGPRGAKIVRGYTALKVEYDEDAKTVTVNGKPWSLRYYNGKPFASVTFKDGGVLGVSVQRDGADAEGALSYFYDEDGDGSGCGDGRYYRGKYVASRAGK